MMYFRYMRYGEEIDEYFRKCDHLLKKSLMENLIFCAVLTNSTLLNGKKKIGENLDLTGIRVTATEKFSIIYYKDVQTRLYKVEFGSEEKMPSCSCPDWKMSAYLCKHFFVFFKKYDCMFLSCHIRVSE